MPTCTAVLQCPRRLLLARAGQWSWHLSGNLYASPEDAPTRGGVPECTAFFWEESQQVRPWLLQDDGRASFRALKDGSNPLCFVRAPYYGLFRWGQG